MRRLVTLLASLSFAAGLTAAQAAYACDCGAHGDDPAAMGECPHAKDGKAKCEEGKDCKCGKDCACSKESKDCKCAKDVKDCKCGPECKCHSGGECANKDCPCHQGDKKADVAKPADAKKADAKPADAKKSEPKKK